MCHIVFQYILSSFNSIKPYSCVQYVCCVTVCYVSRWRYKWRDPMVLLPGEGTIEDEVAEGR